MRADEQVEIPGGSPASPLTGGASRKIAEIDTAWLTREYRRRHGVEVGRFFEGVARVELWQCVDSSLGFFVPGDIVGDEEFYASLANQDWYYFRSRWEHRVAAGALRPGERVLEIGCGDGVFLDLARDAGCEPVGLELSSSAAARCRERGLEARVGDLLEYAETTDERYQVVCSFQVLEHVPDPRAHLEACARLLLPGGRLFVAVPNHDSFVALDPTNVLNRPPHHSLLWNERSLRRAGSLLGLELAEVYREPLQPEHFDYFTYVLGRAGNPGRSLLGRLLWRLVSPRVRTGVEKLASGILGHTIAAEFHRRVPSGSGSGPRR